MKISICIGSSCHLKGSRSVVEQMQKLVQERGLESKIELAGRFCMGNCEHGVCVEMEDKVYSVQPENVNQFFDSEVVPRVQ